MNIIDFLRALVGNLGFVGAQAVLQRYMNERSAQQAAMPQSIPADEAEYMPPVGQNSGSYSFTPAPPVGQTSTTANIIPEEFMPPVGQRYRIHI